MMPKDGDLDPELTVGMPPHITAGTGHGRARALPRGLLLPRLHPMAEGIAVEGMRLVKETCPAPIATAATSRPARR